MFQNGILLNVILSLFFASSVRGLACPNPKGGRAFYTKCHDLLIQAIPMRNVTLADGGLRRGLNLTTGTPSQLLALQIDANSNNTYVFGSNATDSPCLGDVQCATEVGGVFNEENSMPSLTAFNFDAAGASPESQAGSFLSNVWVKENLTLNSTITVENLPIGILSQANLNSSTSSSPPTNSLGLGRNSTFLNTMYAANLIKCKAWSYWHGLTGSDAKNQMDGKLWFGAWDEAKTVGYSLKVPFSTSEESHLIVNITSMNLAFPNGTNSSLSLTLDATQSSFEAKIDTSAPLLTLPQGISNDFLSLAKVSMPPGNGSSEGYINRGAMLYNAASLASAPDLVITLTYKTKNVEIRIPSHQLFVPDYDINSEGQQTITNDSLADVLLYKWKDSDQPFPTLGHPFLTSAYLLVDNELKEFQVWQANPTPEENIKFLYGDLWGGPVSEAVRKSSIIGTSIILIVSFLLV